MNWRAVRETLRLVRLQAKKSYRRIDGVDASTVYRIEQVTRDLDYRPDIDTIERILTACGRTLGWFLRTYGFRRLAPTCHVWGCPSRRAIPIRPSTHIRSTR